MFVKAKIEDLGLSRNFLNHEEEFFSVFVA